MYWSIFLASSSALVQRMTNFLRCEETLDDLRHLAVQQRLAAGDRNGGRAAFVDRLHALLDGQPLVEDLVGIVDLAAARAGQIAAEQRLQHQNQRVALPAGELLPEDIGADTGHLVEGYRHFCFPDAARAPKAGQTALMLKDVSGSRNCAGSRNAINSCTPGSVETSTSPSRAQRGDHVVDRDFRRRGSGGEADRAARPGPSRGRARRRRR